MDAYEKITERIIEALENGTVPWARPWTAAGPPRSLNTGKPYRGINVFMLLMRGYSNPYWLTFKQCKAKGGHVRKGEKGTPIIFWNWKEYTREDDNGDEYTVKRPFIRYYTVFNAEQCEGIETPVIERNREFTPIQEAERVVEGMPQRPEIRHELQRAFYSPSDDFVNMPKPETFESDEAYYEVLFHELGHSTGHKDRLNRPGIAQHAAFGSTDYGREELVAEMTAAFLCGHCGILESTIERSAAYLQSWLKAIKEDAQLVVTAAAQAQKASDFILAKNE